MCGSKLFIWTRVFLRGSNYYCVDQALFGVQKISWWQSGSWYYSVFVIRIFQKVAQVCEIGTSALIKECVSPTAKHLESNEYVQDSKTNTITLANLLANLLIKNAEKILP